MGNINQKKKYMVEAGNSKLQKLRALMEE